MATIRTQRASREFSQMFSDAPARILVRTLQCTIHRQTASSPISDIGYHHPHILCAYQFDSIKSNRRPSMTYANAIVQDHQRTFYIRQLVFLDCLQWAIDWHCEWLLFDSVQ